MIKEWIFNPFFFEGLKYKILYTFNRSKQRQLNWKHTPQIFKGDHTRQIYAQKKGFSISFYLGIYYLFSKDFVLH